jgi:hypothetical protein
MDVIPTGGCPRECHGGACALQEEALVCFETDIKDDSIRSGDKPLGDLFDVQYNMPLEESMVRHVLEREVKCVACGAECRVVPDFASAFAKAQEMGTDLYSGDGAGEPQAQPPAWTPPLFDNPFGFGTPSAPDDNDGLILL